MKLKKAKEQMLKVKERTIKQAALTGVNAMSNQVDGGEEVKQATVTAYMLTRPAVLAGKSGTRFLNTRRKKEEKHFGNSLCLIRSFVLVRNKSGYKQFRYFVL